MKKLLLLFLRMGLSSEPQGSRTQGAPQRAGGSIAVQLLQILRSCDFIRFWNIHCFCPSFDFSTKISFSLEIFPFATLRRPAGPSWGETPRPCRLLVRGGSSNRLCFLKCCGRKAMFSYVFIILISLQRNLATPGWPWSSTGWAPADARQGAVPSTNPSSRKGFHVEIEEWKWSDKKGIYFGR